MAFETDHRVGILVLLTVAACGGGPEEPEVCWSWRANVAQTSPEPLAALDGEHVLLVNDGLLRLYPSGWIVDRATPRIFALQRGDGWTAVAVRGEPGQSDWLELRRDGEDWSRFEAPASLLENRWEAVASDDDSVYVRATSGVIARFDGERWEQVAQAVASNNARLAVAGDVLYDWHDGALDIFEGDAWRRVLDSVGPATIGDAQHVYVHQESFFLLRSTPAGFEPMPAAPGPIEAVAAGGTHVAVRVRGEDAGIYRFVDGGWQLAAREPGLLALDEDGTLLAGDGFGTLLVDPDGTARPLGADVEPVAPLVGDSLERLFAPAARGGLLRLAGDRWEMVEGTAELRISALWHAPDGTVFLATDSDVYRLGDDGLEPLGAPAQGRTLGLVGRSVDEVYLSAVDETDTYLRMYRWDGATWSQLDALALELDGRTPRTPHLFGSRGVLITLAGVSAPDDDPASYWQALASTGEGWSRVSGYNESNADNLHAVQMGTAGSPSAMVLIVNGTELRYEVPDEDNLPFLATQGTFDMQFRDAIAGVDLDHMVGVVWTDGVARFAVRDGDGWRLLGAGQLQAGTSGSPVAWYSPDAVGVASRSGVTLCER